MKLYQAIAQNARIPVDHLKDAFSIRVERIQEKLPRGSGFDCGCVIESATESKIVISTAFHHMDDKGFYRGWTDHKVIVTQTLLYDTPSIRVTGRNFRNIKDYIADVFHSLMSEPFEWVNK